MRFRIRAATALDVLAVFSAVLKRLLFISLALLPRPASAKDIQPADPSTLQSAITRLGAQGGLVAVVLVRVEEPADPETSNLLHDPGVERALGKTALLLAAADRHPALATRFGVKRFPAVVFVDGLGRVAGRLSGLGDPASFAGRVAEIVAACGGRRPGGRPGGGEEADPLALTAAAMRSWSSRDRFEAVALFERALAFLTAPGARTGAAPERAWAAVRAHLALADHLRSSARPAEAEIHYRSALEAIESGEPGPQTPVDLEEARARGLLGLALTRRSDRRLEEAASSLASALEGKPGSPALAGAGRERALHLLGKLREELGDENGALERFGQCAREFPAGRYGQRARRYLAVGPATGVAGEPSLSR
jgi:tetratricopeptide (TPR) repeat protein